MFLMLIIFSIVFYYISFVFAIFFLVIISGIIASKGYSEYRKSKKDHPLHNENYQRMEKHMKQLRKKYDY